MAERMLKLALIVLLLFTLDGCKESSSGRKDNDSKTQPELVFRFALAANPANKAWEAASLIKEELERASNGQIKIMFYDSGVLGSERQLLETCYLGVIEMVQCTSSVVTTIDPTFSLLDLPYLFINEEHHLKVMNGTIGSEILDGLREHKLQGLAFFSCGFRNMFNTRGKQICQPEDMYGLKIRVMESPVMIKSINHMGASATPLSATELFQALKTGVVDGAENNPQVFISEKFYEAGCMNYSNTRHFANQHVLVVNRDWFDKLKHSHPHLHRLVKNVPRKIIDEYNTRWNLAVSSAEAEMLKRGVTMNEIEDLTNFIKAVQPVYDEFFAGHKDIPEEVVDRIRQEANQ